MTHVVVVPSPPSPFVSPPASRGQIELTEAEQDAVTAATLLYDSTPALQELTEKGTVGEVRPERGGEGYPPGVD